MAKWTMVTAIEARLAVAGHRLNRAGRRDQAPTFLTPPGSARATRPCARHHGQPPGEPGLARSGGIPPGSPLPACRSTCFRDPVDPADRSGWGLALPIAHPPKVPF
jgi:hypothetical protein